MNFANVIFVLGAAACAVLGDQAEAFLVPSAPTNTNRATRPYSNPTTSGGKSPVRGKSISPIYGRRDLEVRNIACWMAVAWGSEAADLF